MAKELESAAVDLPARSFGAPPARSTAAPSAPSTDATPAESPDAPLLRPPTATEDLARLVAKICRRIAADQRAPEMPEPIGPQTFAGYGKTSSKGGDRGEA